jgi:hypothetical protein
VVCISNSWSFCSILTGLVALSENSCYPLRTGYATRAPGQNITNGCHGVSCVRRCIVRFIFYQYLFKVLHFVLIQDDFREGIHAKYHYLICGVKGDFTRNLVLNPPTHLWTRQLKVRLVIMTSMRPYRSLRSLPGSRTRPLFIAEGSTCAQVQELAQPFPRAFKCVNFHDFPMSQPPLD